jgi:hypothetical protein
MSEQSMNQMPDLDLDDIEDLPGFSAPPSGNYICALTTEFKTLKEKEYVEFQFEIVELKQLGTQELDNPAVVGQKFGVLFGYNQQGLEFMKPYLKQFKEALKTSGSVKEIVEATTSLNVAVTFKYRTSTGKAGTADAGKEYKNLTIAKLAVL